MNHFCLISKVKIRHTILQYFVLTCLLDGIFSYLGKYFNNVMAFVDSKNNHDNATNFQEKTKIQTNKIIKKKTNK